MSRISQSTIDGEGDFSWHPDFNKETGKVEYPEDVVEAPEQKVDAPQDARPDAVKPDDTAGGNKPAPLP